MSKMNVEDLRDKLTEQFDDLLAGKLTVDKAKEISNMAGKVMNTAKVQMEYNKLTRNKKTIDFLEV